MLRICFDINYASATLIHTGHSEIAPSIRLDAWLRNDIETAVKCDCVHFTNGYTSGADTFYPEILQELRTFQHPTHHRCK